MTFNKVLEKRHITANAALAEDLAYRWWIDKQLELSQEKGVSKISWAISGGRTPRPLYERIARSTELDRAIWQRLSLFLVDERNVASSDRESNIGMIQQTGLLNHLSPEQVHEMYCGPFENSSDSFYQKALLDHTDHGELDLVLLGMGSDGHTASLFPQTDFNRASQQLVITHYVPSLKNWRRSLSLECLLRARHLLFYVTGADKKEALKEVWELKDSPLPAARLLQARLDRGKSVEWIVDAAAVNG